MKIKQSVINTFNRVGIPYEELMKIEKPTRTRNRLTGEGITTTYFLSYLVAWVYQTSNDYEYGINKVNVSDFDRVRYFILEQDGEVYRACLN